MKQKMTREQAFARLDELERQLQFAQDEFDMDRQIELEEKITELEDYIAEEFGDE